ncbi:hypothetical protein DB771_08280 [Burkholderia sp. AU29985]|nr:hypothetical protein XM57_23535 [Burkholderia cepacia]AYZ94067.1 hypothetical protein EGY28_02630 [Burkholderia dolosa]ETP63673.1 hypothetical protein BDSB_17445 [Burkholderia dolosa PC543]PRE42615.1 hypothetical protein C6P87_26430 [Burkholderia sp. AU12872]PUA77284.1 hypothetical protein DB771_08280 [Burkholderia sp. AU29985]
MHHRPNDVAKPIGDEPAAGVGCNARVELVAFGLLRVRSQESPQWCTPIERSSSNTYAFL